MRMLIGTMSRCNHGDGNHRLSSSCQGRASARCRINECRFASSSGRRIESITLPVTVFNPKKSKKFVLARHWFSVQSLTAETLPITYWAKPHRGGIFSALLSSFPMVRVFLLRPDR